MTPLEQLLLDLSETPAAVVERKAAGGVFVLAVNGALARLAGRTLVAEPAPTLLEELTENIEASFGPVRKDGTILLAGASPDSRPPERWAVTIHPVASRFSQAAPPLWVMVFHGQSPLGDSFHKYSYEGPALSPENDSLKAHTHNVTRRKIAEARLKDAIENLAGAFVLWDAKDRLVLYNSKARDLYGGENGVMVPSLTFAEVLRRSVASGRLDVPPDAVEAWIQERVRRHQACAEVLTRHYPDGRWMRITEHRTSEGGIVGIGVDITELKRREIELEHARQQAEQASHAKSRFLAAASHDLRQPLHAMGLLLSALGRTVRGQEKTRLVHDLEASLDTMNELLSAILDLSRLEAAILKPDVRPLVLETIFDRLRRRFTLPARDKGLGMRIRPCRAMILSDPAMLERILANLTANAVQHTLRGRVLVGCRRKGTDLHIGIWDTGPGIVPEQIPEIFKEYHQLHNAARNRRQGLGLGLAIVDRLARLLHHRIEVRSTPGKGVPVHCRGAPRLPRGMA